MGEHAVGAEKEVDHPAQDVGEPEMEPVRYALRVGEDEALVREDKTHVGEIETPECFEERHGQQDQKGECADNGFAPVRSIYQCEAFLFRRTVFFVHRPAKLTICSRISSRLDELETDHAPRSL